MKKIIIIISLLKYKKGKHKNQDDEDFKNKKISFYFFKNEKSIYPIIKGCIKGEIRLNDILLYLK